ncbi:hypothetical protein [Azohydromonas aeria]|uniref:hypothetical protein n=1 Tax=Azohydromonas aeria TaxID=2590212 RepID=UPI0012F99C87|nr:hypothetical protein [Azohydromonas aeria]
MPKPTKLHCPRCRARFNADLSLWVHGSDFYRQVQVHSDADDRGRLRCSCGRCGHFWWSSSAEAAHRLREAEEAAIAAAAKRQDLGPVAPPPGLRRRARVSAAAGQMPLL